MFFAMMTAAMMGTGAEDVDKSVYQLVKDGKVASLSSDYKGTPFGSLMPYAVDDDGRPIIYISTLAVHTKNLNKNPKASVMITKVDEKDVFNSARITLAGKMVKVSEKEAEAVGKVFFAKFKDAKRLSEFHDFNFYRLEIDRIYYIGGFGDIQWIDPADYKKGFPK